MKNKIIKTPKKSFLANKNFLSFLSGTLLVLAFAPFYLFPFSLISFSIFFLLIEEKLSFKKVFLRGFLFGFGFFLAGIYWISISLLVDAEKFAWLIPFALTFIPGLLASYIGVMAIAYKFLCEKLKLVFTYQKIILFSILWLFFELIRATLFTGFPWNLLGYVWLFDVRFAQLSSVFGVYGLSFFAVIISLLPIIFIRNKKNILGFGDKIFAYLAIIFMIFNFVFGLFHIHKNKVDKSLEINLRLVQANISQDIKWKESEKYQNLIKHIVSSSEGDSKNLDAVIWSETSVPYAISEESGELIQILQKAVPDSGVLITGALRLNLDYDQKKVFNIWNSTFVVDKEGVYETYDKHHLVPFGEYVPLYKYFSFLMIDGVIDKITGGGFGFSEGEGAKTIHLKKFSFSPLICYEAIFSSEVMNKQDSADVFINLTNDAWFGKSIGPYQHFDIARMRAIEYGKPLLRVASTGISAYVDQFGRVIEKLPLQTEGIIDAKVYKSLSTTLYSKYRNLPLLTLILLMVSILKISQLTNSKNNIRISKK